MYCKNPKIKLNITILPPSKASFSKAGNGQLLDTYKNLVKYMKA